MEDASPGHRGAKNESSHRGTKPCNWVPSAEPSSQTKGLSVSWPPSTCPGAPTDPNATVEDKQVSKLINEYNTNCG